MACAVGTPSVSVFGPSDPVRYFSGGTRRPRHAPRRGARRAVVLALQPDPPAARGVRAARSARVPAPGRRWTRSTARPRACCVRRRRPAGGGARREDARLLGRRLSADARARQRAGRGAPALDGRRRGALGRRPPRTPADYLGSTQRRRSTRRRSPGPRPGAGGRCATAGASASSYAWKGVSLWWFAELYLHHSTASPRRVRTIETLRRVLERERPDEVEAVGLPARGRAAAGAHLHRARRPLPRRRARARRGATGARAQSRWRSRWNTRQDAARPRSRPRWRARRRGRPRRRQARRAVPVPRRLLARARRSADGDGRRRTSTTSTG